MKIQRESRPVDFFLKKMCFYKYIYRVILKSWLLAPYCIYFDDSSRPEDISENVGVSHHCKNLKFENFGESHQWKNLKFENFNESTENVSLGLI